MNINDMNQKYSFAQVKKILESRFNWVGRWDDMSLEEVQDLGSKAQTKLDEAGDIRSPKYNLYLFIREAAAMRVGEMKALAESVGDETVDQAEVVLAAKEIGDKLQGMAEDIAQMQVQDMMPLVQAMKEQLGLEQAQAFEGDATAALQGLLDTMKSSKDAYDNAVLVLQGEAPANDMGQMGGDDAGFGDMDSIDTDGDGEMEPMDGDDFAGADAEAGDENPVGRDMKESADERMMAALKAVQENSKDGKISKAQLEAIKQQVSERPSARNMHRASKKQADDLDKKNTYTGLDRGYNWNPDEDPQMPRTVRPKNKRTGKKPEQSPNRNPDAGDPFANHDYARRTNARMRRSGDYYK